MAGAGSVVEGATDTGSAILTSAGIGGASGSAVATSALAFGEAGAELAGAAESEAGVDAAADVIPRPSFTTASADDPKNANNMAATATLTSLPLT